MPLPKKVETDPDGWSTVSRKKVKKEKTLEDLINRPVSPTENDEDSVWDQPQLHETCWEDKTIY